MVLEKFGHEWGHLADTKALHVRVGDLAPGANALIWRDDDHELRMWLTIHVEVHEREVRFQFEFPLLYKHKNKLQLVHGLGKIGWESCPVT